MAPRQLMRPTWCPSCSLDLLRAFASACGTAPPTRYLGRGVNRRLTTSATSLGLTGPVARRNLNCSNTTRREQLVVRSGSRPYSTTEKHPDQVSSGSEVSNAQEVQDKEKLEAESSELSQDDLKALESLEAKLDNAALEREILLDKYSEIFVPGYMTEGIEELRQPDVDLEQTRSPIIPEDQAIEQLEAKLDAFAMEIEANVNIFEDIMEDIYENYEVQDLAHDEQAAQASLADSNEYKEDQADENIEFKATETSVPAETKPGETPWYMQAPIPPAPRRYISPLIEQMPPLPQNPPEQLDGLLNYLLKDLSLSKLKIMDLRGLDPAPAIGPNVLMILATARSERHMSITADKCCRYLRSMLSGTNIYADGLIGRGERRLTEKRERRKGKRRTAEDEEAMRVGWICVNSGRGIVVQIMTGWKREELNLEALWSRKINTSEKRKLRERLIAEGLSEEAIKQRVAAEVPDILEAAPEFDPNEILPPLSQALEGYDEEELDAYRPTRLLRKPKAKREEPPSKPSEWKRLSEVPAVSKKTLRMQKRNTTIFATKRGFSTSTRAFSSVAEAVAFEQPVFHNFPTIPLDAESDRLVKMGNYKEVLRMYPRPRTATQASRVLLAHLNHLALADPDTARMTILADEPARAKETPLFTSFKLSWPKEPTPTHHHIKSLLYITAHNLSPSAYPLKWYVKIPSDALFSGSQVSLVTYQAILRAVATSSVLRARDPHSLRFWTNRTSDILSVMMLYLMKKMDVSGIELANDPEVFESIWLGLSPGDTRQYIGTLGNPGIRSGYVDVNKSFSRALDHRAELFRTFHKSWYNPATFVPKENRHLVNPLDVAEFNRLVHPSLVYPPIRPRNRYSTLPSYVVTMFVTMARTLSWRGLRDIWKWLPVKRIQRPKLLYALYFELLAREAQPDNIITTLRFLTADYEREHAGNDELEDGVAETLLACIEYIEKEVPGTGLEFNRWRRRCITFLSRRDGVPDPMDGHVDDR